MPENENIDLTDELVKEVEPVQMEIPQMEATPTRNAIELMKVPFDEMTEDEKRYFISASKMKIEELDAIAQKAFEENRKLREVHNANLKLMEDTLTFIKTSVGNCYGAISLAIKNMEREVK